jgi:NAD(P)-dependent dehydrogenase (short-subunit alcohol dehydrogenase family)
MSVVVITGSSTGIGMAAAQALARAGHRVFATMRTPETSALAKALSEEALPIRMLALDVDQDASVCAAFRQIEAEAGSIDVLVNNAGVAQIAAIEDAPMELFRSTMETNFFGAIRCIKAVLPGMRTRRGGCIINVSSIAGRLATGGFATYCASKWALEAASESLAQELKPFGIRVAIVEPGVIKTPIFDKLADVRTDTPYPYECRWSALYQASFQHPVRPEVAGEAIREIVNSGTWQLRHPVGPDAAPFLSWRSRLTDEQWVDYWTRSDGDWCAAMLRDFGMEINLTATLPPKGLKATVTPAGGGS